MMTYKFSNDKPIFVQIYEQIQSEIVSNKLSHGQKLPSVRVLAEQYKVNPNTIQKALSLLEDKGLIYTDRTNGKFVSHSKNLISETHEQIIETKINSFFEEMQKLGYTEKEIIKLIKKREKNKWANF